MFKSKIFLFFVFFHWFCSQIHAQDVSFTQFYHQPLYLNPAFTGTSPQYRLSATYRNQWASVGNSYGSNMISYDYNWDYYHSGIGFMASNDRAGTGKLMTTNLSAFYAYQIMLNRKWVARAGLQGGYSFKSIDQSGLVFEDQMLSGNPSKEVFASQSINFADFAAGVLFYSEDLWFGLAFRHLSQPQQAFLGAIEKTNLHFSAHLGTKIAFHRKSENYISPAILYQQQGNSSQMDIGFNLFLAPISVGLWYRGMPWAKNVANTLNQDAIAGFVGLRIKKDWKIGYSYDYTISKFAGTGGTHEISLIFSPHYDKRNKRGSMHINCPALSGF